MGWMDGFGEMGLNESTGTTWESIASRRNETRMMHILLDEWGNDGMNGRERGGNTA